MRRPVPRPAGERLPPASTYSIRRAEHAYLVRPCARRGPAYPQAATVTVRCCPHLGDLVLPMYGRGARSTMCGGCLT